MIGGALSLPSTTMETIARLDPIGLTQLECHAGLHERKDRKYLVDPHGLDLLTGELSSSFRALEVDSSRSFAYETTYFDTPAHDSYLAAARRRPQRWKVRTRSYVDAGLCNLEVKLRLRNGNTVKHRLPYDYVDRGRLTAEAHAFLSLWDFVDSGRLNPASTVNYTRSTLVDTGSWSRVTLDTDLKVSVDSAERLRVDDFLLVETKSLHEPTTFDRQLWSHGYRPTSISKYCTLLAAVDPSLPANHWNRVLRRHFDREHAWSHEQAPLVGSDHDAGFGPRGLLG